MFKKVLVATDFSPCAQRALEVARSHFPQAELKVLHVVTEDSPFTATEALLELEMLVSDTWSGETGLPGHEVVPGSPTQQVVESARAWSADLIVVGVSGQGGQGLGSVAEGVVRASAIPVLTVKAHEAGI
ncbi:universal stress protein [uncultured Meiothermus sp.]|jgi:nucleotide-binding universal stress UspA family protein|uniref:universal stress protein n=1 Tax=uncultured Meiothermus sp. TaxID=157471 RepID=UPI00262EA89F|nr:universal stress protein [uncultured Meiothermus sp.]